MQAALPDLLRLVAVPVLGWAALQDVRTRRVTNHIWWPLALLGAALVVWEGLGLVGAGFDFRLYSIRVGISLGIVIPLAYAFWYVGGFGGADAKAFMVLAILFPTFPTYEVFGQVFPVVATDLGVFSLSVLTNTVLIGLLYPVALGARNLLRGEYSWVMFLGHRVPVRELPARHGTLLQTPEGLTRRGLDLDALRMYLRWRGIDLATLRANPDLADPATLPAAPNDPTDGAVFPDGGATSEEASAAADSVGAADSNVDRWGAEHFLDDIDSSAYGTTPETLRAGLDVVVSAESVWVSPGIPFIVPTFAGLLVALLAGDLLFVAMTWLGLVGP